MMYDVIIIGAGQAGLSMGYHLKKNNLSFLILDSGKGVGEVWRERYDSLVLFTTRSYSALPGLQFEGEQNDYPTKDEVADYLSYYAKKFSLPVQLNTTVQRMLKAENGFSIRTNNGELTARQVVVATGPFQTPFIPKVSEHLSDDVYQIHSSQYRNPKQLKKGSALVVGGGNSGAQIAVELSKERDVYLSVGHKMKFFPQVFGKKNIFWWFEKLGLLHADVNSKVGRFLRRQSDPIFGLELKTLIKQGKVILKPRTISIENDKFLFEDVSQIKVNNVIWSTGFKSDYRWIDIPDVFNEKGFPIHDRGITSIEGLYFLGLPWQYRRGSGLLYGVGEDAAYLARNIK
jgi:putative flavoprotein involved in K+ transport